MIERRSFARGAGLLWLLARLPAVAQPANRLPRVAHISAEAPLAQMVGPDPIDANARGFVHGLRDLGWVDGRNVIIKGPLSVTVAARGVDLELIRRTSGSARTSRWVRNPMKQPG